MVLNRKVLKRCSYLVATLLLLQFFLYYTNKYRTDFMLKDALKIKEVKPGEKVSWENKTLIECDAKRTGPGEQGLPYELDNPDESALNKELIKKEGFAVLVSDKISFDRALPDKRPPTCSDKKYLRNLPKVSVIITFHNEIWSVLLRCIHSICNRSPPELLHEIILINDGSTFEELYVPLEKYFNGSFGSKVKIHHNEKRMGLIRARMVGARLATAEAIIFLDSHMEVTNTWLPPLLEPLVFHPTFATVPIVESMNHATFAYEYIGHGYRGTFDWNFRYQWLPRPQKDEMHISDNYELSSMTGGAYAIRREHFFYLGGYDEELKIWNGENYELSLKLWLCSGGIFAVPCSRIVHLSKTHTAYRFSNDRTDFVGRNLKRVAEIWLDDYKKYFYRGDPKRYARIDAGDLSKQFELKARLNCKPFKYFLDVVAPEMLERYPLEPQYFASGEIRNQATGQCVSLKNLTYNIPLVLADCSQDLRHPRKSLDFLLTFERSIKFNDSNDQCLNDDNLALSNCHHQFRSQHWVFNITTRQISSPHMFDKCLVGKGSNATVALDNCDVNSSFQKWTWSRENATALLNWHNTGIKVNY